jgi:GNAT superfamily N-acetyltransferase
LSDWITAINVSGMINIGRTNSDSIDFRMLVAELDAELKIRDGEDHSFFNQFNKIEGIKYVVVAYDPGDIPVGCGAIRELNANTMEVKRMFVLPDRRGQGVASAILKELEQWAIELNFVKCLLETGKKQPDAIGLYQKNGYRIIPNYGQYENIESSVCFLKMLTK